MARRKQTAQHVHLATSDSDRITKVVCDHCGALLTIQLPLDLDKFIKSLDSFDRIHRTCEPRPTNEQ